MNRQPEKSKAPSHAYRALAHRDYRLLWGAEGLSTAGSQIQRVAIAWQVFEMTGDPFKLGLLGLCRFVPVVLFGIAGGVLADRGDRRRTLMLTQLGLLLISAVLALLTASGSIVLWMIYALVILGATVEGISNPTRQALIPALVPRQDLPAAVTMNLLIFSVAAVTGPAIGGIIIGQFSVAAAYAFDALSFAVVIGAVLLMHARPAPIPITQGGFAAAMEGLRFLRGTPVLLGVMTADFVATFFGASTSLMPIFATEILGVGPEGLGFLLAAPAAGAFITAIILSIWRLPDRGGKGVLVSVALYGAFLIGFGMSTTFLLSLVFLAGSGAADAVSMTLRHSLRQVMTPDPLLGRVAAVHRTLGVGGPQLGEFESGVAATLIGAGPAVTLGGIATVGSAFVIAWLVPAITRFHFSDVPPQSPGGAKSF